ncbi:SOM1 Protein SOM1 [Candida maltosa Xu316]|uniref:Uncharacterized protein n=1 Tax=Candida maltosa (strain Xu316) TaxID=1245528 RepID=M3ISA7_CANMX|nr:hypothetical protein G210_5780 [Candida maltosa Xu316]
MAPPVPVYNASEIQNQYKEQLNNLEKYKCQLRSITQHECTFKPSTIRNNGNSPPEIICLPFKRIFQRCLVPAIIKNDYGVKVKTEKWINIEITNEKTNHDLVEPDSKYSKVVQEFLSAEQEFKKFMEIESDGQI